jgi:hypothetical protein
MDIENLGRNVTAPSAKTGIEATSRGETSPSGRLHATHSPRPHRASTHTLLLAMALLTIVVASIMEVHACTIASGIDKHGQVWTANNEDGGPGQKYVTSIYVYPKADSARYGYFTLNYDMPDYGIQGGMNESGLTFDFNALQGSGEVKDRAKKKSFTRGNDGIMPYILANMETVEEVVALFDEFWFDQPSSKWQIHAADRHGHFAIIGPSGSSIQKNLPYQVSTNFDIVGKEDGSGCWRFPIATKKLQTDGASLATMIDICKRTSQNKEGVTLYSNVQNLATGDVWFFINRDFERPFKSNLKTLLAKGKKSYLMSNLNNEEIFSQKQ